MCVYIDRFELSHFMCQLGKKKIRDAAPTPCSLNNVKSKLWEVILRDVDKNGPRLFDVCNHLHQKHWSYLLRLLWSNNKHKYDNELLMKLASGKKIRNSLLKMPVEVNLYMCEYLTMKDMHRLSETSVILNYFQLRKGFLPYWLTLCLKDNSLKTLAKLIGVKELCKRLIWSNHILQYNDCELLYRNIAGDAPLYEMTQPELLFIPDIFVTVVLNCDLMTILKLIGCCRDFYRFIMRYQFLRQIIGIRFIELTFDAALDYEAGKSGSYLLQIASHIYCGISLIDYELSQFSTIVNNNLTVYQGTVYVLDGLSENMIVLNWIYDQSQTESVYKRDEKFWDLAELEKCIPIYVVDDDSKQVAPPYALAEIMVWRHSKIGTDLFWHPIQDDKCRYFYLHRVYMAYPFWFDYIDIDRLDQSQLTKNKHLYALDCNDYLQLYDLISCGNIFKTLFTDLFIWNKRSHIVSGITAVLSYISKIAQKQHTALSRLTWIFTASSGNGHYYEKNKKDDPIDILWTWLFQYWERFANNPKLKKCIFALIVQKPDTSKSCVMINLKTIINKSQLEKYHEKWMKCLNDNTDFDSSDVFELWQSLWTPFKQVANKYIQQFTHEDEDE